MKDEGWRMKDEGWGKLGEADCEVFSGGLFDFGREVVLIRAVKGVAVSFELLLAQALADPRRIAPTVEDRVDQGRVIWHGVIDCERESFRKQAAVTGEVRRMGSGIEPQRVDIRPEAAQKIVANTGLLPLVKCESLDQVILSAVENPYLHGSAPRFVRGPLPNR